MSALAALLLSACAHGPRPVHLHPAPQAVRTAVGAGVALAVDVVDKRAESVEMPSAVRTRTRFPIRGDLSEAVRRALVAGLKDQGFRTDAAGGEPSLTVAVTRFDYWVLGGVGTADIRATVVLDALARRPDASFPVTYKAENHRVVAVTPRRKDVEETVNGALEAALRQVLNDDQLLGFLAARP